MFRHVLFCICIALTATPAIAADWGPLSRERALAQLDSTHSHERRAALARLAEVGTDADIPFMLQRLHDDDNNVRGMAEQALWGLWLRSNDMVVTRQFHMSLALFLQKDYLGAIAQLDEIIAYKPDFAEAWNKRGDAFSHLGDFDQALASYRHALKLNPYQFSVMQSCGEILMERREARGAANYFRRALDINPNLYEVALILRELEERLENDRI